MECPWYVSAKAVRDYMALTGMRDFDDASDRLIELCAEVAHRYVTDPSRQPARKDNGCLVYRGPRPGQFRFVVSTAPRPEGPKPQLVAVQR